MTNSHRTVLDPPLYRPPNAGQSWWGNFNSFLEEVSSRYINMIICGDFNFPKLHWHFPSATSSGDDVTFTGQLNDFFLTQVNTLPTRGKNELNQVITSLLHQIENISKLKPMDSGLFTDHDTIVFNLKTSSCSIRSSKRNNFRSHAVSIIHDTSSGLVFSQDKCKCHRVTGKKNSIKHEYKINSKSLVVIEKEKDRCTKANTMLGFLRRAAM